MRPLPAPRLLAYLGLYIFWGTTFLSLRVAVPFVPPFFLSGVRHTTAGLLLLVLARSQGSPWPRGDQMRGAATLGFFFLGVANGICAWAMQFVESGYATLFIAGVPLVVVVYGALFQGRRVGRKEVWLLLLGLLGVGLLLAPQAAAAHSSSWKGLLALLLATLVWSVAMAEKGRLSLPSGALMTTSFQMFGGGLSLLAFSYFFEHPGAWDPGLLPFKAWAAWVYLVIFGSCVGYAAFAYLLQRDPPYLVGTYSYVNPLVAVVLGHWILGERVTPIIFLSGSLVMVSVAGLLWVRRN